MSEKRIDRRERSKVKDAGGGHPLTEQRAYLLAGMALALLVVIVLVMSVNPGSRGGGGATLSQGMLTGTEGLDIDSRSLASRVVEQKFQAGSEETAKQLSEIPYVELYVLNDPFYPLMGEVANLKDTSGVLAGKQWQMLGFPVYEQGQTTGAPSQAPSGAVPVTTELSQRVVMVTSVYEIRGIRYADIKVNDTKYEKLKAGSEFASVFKVQEVKDSQTVVVVCGDETYELKVNQLRKI